MWRYSSSLAYREVDAGMEDMRVVGVRGWMQKVEFAVVTLRGADELAYVIKS